MGKSFVVTGGSELIGHKPFSKHYTNQAFDMSHLNQNRDLTFCCALKCGIKYIKDESLTAGHWHFQTVPGKGGSKGSLPNKSVCERILCQ